MWRNMLRTRTLCLSYQKMLHWTMQTKQLFENSELPSALCQTVFHGSRVLLSQYSQRRPHYNVVVPGNVSKHRVVPNDIQKPLYVSEKHFDHNLYTSHAEEIKNEKQITGMRDSGAVACAILQYAGMLIKPGVTTDEIDAKVHDIIVKQNAYPSPLRYKGFPKSICTSVNNIACHGIPDDRELQCGDIINIDVTVYYNGFHGDCSDTFTVGQVDAAAEVLIDVTRSCRDDAIAQCGPGVPLCTIGNTISDITELLNYSVGTDMVGHGIGEYFHGLPDVYHCRNEEPGIMKEGMTFTIEPILSEGSNKLRLLNDGWTLTTVDNSRTAQCEHTILITSNGAEILTAFEGDR